MTFGGCRCAEPSRHASPAFEPAERALADAQQRVCGRCFDRRASCPRAWSRASAACVPHSIILFSCPRAPRMPVVPRSPSHLACMLRRRWMTSIEIRRVDSAGEGVRLCVCVCVALYVRVATASPRAHKTAPTLPSRPCLAPMLRLRFAVPQGMEQRKGASTAALNEVQAAPRRRA